MKLKKCKAPAIWQVSATMEPEPGSDQDVPIAVRFRVDQGGVLVYLRGWAWSCAVPATESWALESWLQANEDEILVRLGF